MPQSLRLALAASLALLALPCFGQRQSFFLHPNDRVVFYGDSITEQRLYTSFVETAVHAAYPGLHVAFLNAGVGGDKVSGGGAGPIDERLDRDVIAHHPTVVTIMLGMNDRNTDATRAAYRPGYEHILERLETALPGVRLFLIAPSPLDDVTRPAPRHPNDVLQSFTHTVHDLAEQHHAGFLDWNTPLHAALEHADSADHRAAVLALPDRVHPTDGFHLLMADLLLRAWGLPEVSASTTLDVTSSAATGLASGQPISATLATNGTLTWTESDLADTHYLDPTNGNEQLYHLLTATDHPGRRVLRVTGLPEGNYKLRIDDSDLAPTWDAATLARGVDLSQLLTPMLAQSRRIFYGCSDAELLQTAQLRFIARAHELSPPSNVQADALIDANQALAQRKIDSSAEPQKHTYILTRIP